VCNNLLPKTGYAENPYDGLGTGRIERVAYIVDPAACAPTEATAQAS